MIELYKSNYETQTDRENKDSFEYFKEMNPMKESDVQPIGHFVTNFIDETLQPLVDKYLSLDVRVEKVNSNSNLCGVFLNHRINLTRLYEQFQEKIRLDRPGKTFVMNSAINMVRLSLISESEISDSQIAVEFALSKMTVIDEV